MIPEIFESNLQIPAGDAILEGNLRLPADAQGLILFIHGSGSSRFSTRNRHVAQLLNQAGLATLLFDLLTADENQIDMLTREFRFDIPLLSERSRCAIDYVARQPQLAGLPIGLFGASTGAAAALFAAESLPEKIKTVVSRGGRPDLAQPVLAKVQATTLLIVGGLDYDVLQLNKQAQSQMHAECELTVIPGATHLFEEPGTLDLAADAAREWFLQKLGNGQSAT
ncbi:dienelactone hydrolase family protein [Thiomicrorhabdus xiamenensis]|uniref:Dienelactone hydrolase family protein n=1 Tax=Thiomicrorhabdus xiamenensis TaxID=2739063 RepID=A0A7D4NS91_9GAMM|nr:dienelactone hydrolase family protein [Thiomicrorhabdus xiamenensis]QKI90250.1 dienelactone hydrolase family protein [Thiomicrorhabdus xiamenensis]